MVHKCFACPDCGGNEGYRSRPRSFFEKYLLPMVFLAPWRCTNCYGRFYASSTMRKEEDISVENLSGGQAA